MFRNASTHLTQIFSFKIYSAYIPLNKYLTFLFLLDYLMKFCPVAGGGAHSFLATGVKYGVAVGYMYLELLCKVLKCCNMTTNDQL